MGNWSDRYQAYLKADEVEPMRDYISKIAEAEAANKSGCIVSTQMIAAAESFVKAIENLRS